MPRNGTVRGVTDGAGSIGRVRLTTSALHADLPSLASETYLNTGGCGPLTRAAADALAGWAADAMARGRGSMAGFGRAEAASVALRDDLGRLVGDADGARIALTGNTTDGLNRVAWGVGLRPGDEVVTPALEYPGTLVLLANAARRARRDAAAHRPGRRRRRTWRPPSRRSPGRGRGWWWCRTCRGPPGRCSTWPARCAPPAGPARWSRWTRRSRRGPSRWTRRRWGPTPWRSPPTSGSWARRGSARCGCRRRRRGRSTSRSPATRRAATTRADGTLTLHPGARRHEAATLPAALLPAWRASLGWLEREVGWERVVAGTRAAQAAGRAALAAIPGVRVLTPPGPQAGLVSFTVDGHAPEAVARRLAADGVIVRWIRRPEVLRASLGFFTVDEDVARLAAGVAAVATGDGC